MKMKKIALAFVAIGILFIVLIHIWAICEAVSCYTKSKRKSNKRND